VKKCPKLYLFSHLLAPHLGHQVPSNDVR